MDYGILTEPQIGGTYAAQVRLARFCEDNDVAVFGRSDHYLWGSKPTHATDAFASLAGLARDTTTAKLCVLVSPITFRHPAVIAKTAATIDEMSGGRMILGVGTGWMEAEHDAFGMELWPMNERFARLEEALQYLRAAFSGGGFDGEYYRLADREVRPRPQNLPIIVGGGGPKKTPTLAGRYADEYNQFSARPDALEERFDVFRKAAVDAGRDPDSILISIVSQAYVGRNDAEYSAVIEAAAAARDLSRDEFEDRIGSRNIVHGTPDRVADQMTTLRELGVGRLYVQILDPLDDVDTDALARTFAIIRG